MQLVIEVHEEQVLAKIRQIEHGIDRLIGYAAADLARMGAEEGGKHSARLGARWPVTGFGKTRKVSAPEWWAHFVAGGTSPHGPRKAKMLVFQINGETVFARHVAGQPATRFDVSAMNRTRGHMRTILERAIGGF